MLESNILIEPIFVHNLTNITTLFPEDKFNDFYNGNYINDRGEGYYNFFCEKNKLPIFLRGGKIILVQLLDEYYDIYIGNKNIKNYEFNEENNLTIEKMKTKSIQLLIALDNNMQAQGRILLDEYYDIYIGNNNAKNNDFNMDGNLSMEKMKQKPIQLLVALDFNMQAQGRILIDDFNTNDSKKKKIFYKMIITVSQRTNDISIFFRVYTFKYNLPSDLFKNCINRLIIYGFTKLSIKKITIMNKNGRVELDRSKLIFSQTSDVLTIPNINVPLNMDTKILII